MWIRWWLFRNYALLPYLLFSIMFYVQKQRERNIELIKTIFCRTKNKRILRNLWLLALFSVKLIVCEYTLSLAQILRANKRQSYERIVPTANCYVRHRHSSVYFLCLSYFLSPLLLLVFCMVACVSATVSQTEYFDKCLSH